MTITKRKALRGSVKDCLKYIMNPNKTMDNTLVTGLNCSPETAYNEMLMIDRMYQNKGSRKGYHIIQSFNNTDIITPEQAHQIGLKTMQQLYPDYQIVCVTHVDHAHIHNHFCLNAINMKTGKKLNDSLKHKEGLNKLRDVSDQLSEEHNLTVIKNAPPITSYGNSKTNYHTSNSLRSKIVNDIDRLLLEAKSFDMLLDLLKIEGYQIKIGKDISLKPVGAKRFIRLSSISNGEYAKDKIMNDIVIINKLFDELDKQPIFTNYKFKYGTRYKPTHRDLIYNGFERMKLLGMIRIVKRDYSSYQMRRYEILRSVININERINKY